MTFATRTAALTPCGRDLEISPEVSACAHCVILAQVRRESPSRGAGRRLWYSNSTESEPVDRPRRRWSPPSLHEQLFLFL